MRRSLQRCQTHVTTLEAHCTPSSTPWCPVDVTKLSHCRREVLCMAKQEESFVRRSCIDESQPQSSIVGSACPSWRGGRFFSTRQYGHPRHGQVSQSEPRFGLHEARHLPTQAALIQGSGGATIRVSGIGYVVGYVISDTGHGRDSMRDSSADARPHGSINVLISFQRPRKQVTLSAIT